MRANEAPPAEQDARRIPATERVLDFILREMDQGRLRPGARINAARISATLQLSAAPVREALGVLAGRGVVDLLPDRGAVMRPLTPSEVCQLWELIGPISAVGLSQAAAAIQQGADPEELERKYADIVAAAAGSSALAFILSLNDWHFTANGLGGNPFVSLSLDRLGVAYWDRYLVELVDVFANIAGYLENYRRMHEAVMAADGAAAAAILIYHANWSIKLVRSAEARLARTPRRKRRVPDRQSEAAVNRLN